MKKMIAIIPARCGSKGLKDKNILNLAGKPLLAYSIEAAHSSNLFDTIHVSTDSKNYAQIALKYGAAVAFLRSAEYAGDGASTCYTVKVVLEKYKHIGKQYDLCVVLQPTSPLRTARDIQNAYKLFIDKEADALTSVTETEHPIQWCFNLDNTCSMKNFANSPYKNCRRQDLEKYYRENGAIYIFKTDMIFADNFDFYEPKKQY